MPKSILILKGSPREKGNSSALADRLAEGARAAGAAVESVNLQDLNIAPCNACDLCGEQGQGCVIDDDMQDLYPKIAAAEALVLASPIYWFTYSAQLKLCIDRWYGYQGNRWGELRGKPFAILLTYGDTDLYTSGGINAIHTFETMCRFLKSEIVGIVHGTAMGIGDIEKQPDLLDQAYRLGQKLASV
ncbi:MAG: flavodoxin family protein [Anaerolineales bacterium]|nr:flavodoxin family protein [Anaerolineales bacterium]